MPEYTIAMRPMPKQRPRVVTVKGKTHTYMPTAYMRWKRDFAAALRSYNPPCLSCPCSLSATLSFTDAKHGDLDNLVGAVMDAANTILYTDDRLVHQLNITLLLKQPQDSITVAVA